MGASFYTLQWAEQQWARLERGEALDKHDQRALLLVYRTSLQNALAKLRDVAVGMRLHADEVEQQAEELPEIVYRNGTWRVRENDESDEQDL